MTNSDLKSVLYHENLLRFDASDFQKSYKVEIIIEEDINNKSRITYEVHIQNIEVLSSGNYLASVVMNRFLINNRNPDSLIGQLAHKCRKAFEYIVFMVAKNGEITGVHNYPEILEKWKRTRQKLAVEYSGEVFEKYIALMERTISSSEAFLFGMRQDIFISQFYFPLYEESFEEFSKQNMEKVSFFGIDYEIDMILQIQEKGQPDKAGHLNIAKTIDKKVYDFSQMPIDSYNTAYTLNQKMEIIEIKGEFENHNRKYNFHIVAK